MAENEQHEKLNALRETYYEEQGKLQRELNEIEVLIRQGMADVEKLSQRELSVSNRIRDLDVNLERYSKAEIKNFYAAAQEVQARLQMMRAQLEQLQVRQAAMRKQQGQLSEVVDILNDVLDNLGSASSTSSSNGGGSTDHLATIIQTHESELLRISLQIHDGPVQVMSNLVLRAEICQRLIDRDLDQARAEIASLKTAINSTLQQGRRLIFDLHPMTLADLGLVPTLRRFGTQFSEQHGIEVNIIVQNLDVRLPSYYEVAIFRFVQEALNNVHRHSGANSARVLVSTYEDSLQIVIEDDGSGFQTSDVASAQAPIDQVGSGYAESSKRRGMGIPNMRQRAELMLRGQFDIESAIGRGTRVAATIPLP